MSVRTVARLWGWVFLAYAAFYSGWGAFEYVTGPVEFYDFAFRAKYLTHLGTVWTHGVSSVLALVLGPFQFVSWLPQRAHRMLGWAYFVCLFLGGLSGLAMGMWAYGGPVAQAGFVALALGWLVTSGLACYTVVQRRFREHRAWAIRSYALTFSAVNIRIALYWLEYLELPFEVIYPWTAWGAWLITLGLAEWLLVRRWLARGASGVRSPAAACWSPRSWFAARTISRRSPEERTRTTDAPSVPDLQSRF